MKRLYGVLLASMLVFLFLGTALSKEVLAAVSVDIEVNGSNVNYDAGGYGVAIDPGQTLTVTLHNDNNASMSYNDYFGFIIGTHSYTPPNGNASPVAMSASSVTYWNDQTSAIDLDSSFAVILATGSNGTQQQYQLPWSAGYNNWYGWASTAFALGKYSSNSPFKDVVLTYTNSGSDSKYMKFYRCPGSISYANPAYEIGVYSGDGGWNITSNIVPETFDYSLNYTIAKRPTYNTFLQNPVNYFIEASTMKIVNNETDFDQTQPVSGTLYFDGSQPLFTFWGNPNPMYVWGPEENPREPPEPGVPWTQQRGVITNVVNNDSYNVGDPGDHYNRMAYGQDWTTPIQARFVPDDNRYPTKYFTIPLTSLNGPEDTYSGVVNGQGGSDGLPDYSEEAENDDRQGGYEIGSPPKDTGNIWVQTFVPQDGYLQGKLEELNTTFSTHAPFSFLLATVGAITSFYGAAIDPGSPTLDIWVMGDIEHITLGGWTGAAITVIKGVSTLLFLTVLVIWGIREYMSLIGRG